MTDLGRLEEYVEEHYQPDEETPKEWVAGESWPNRRARAYALDYARIIRDSVEEGDETAEEAFADAGGRVISRGGVPVDGVSVVRLVKGKFARFTRPFMSILKRLFG